MTTKRTPETPEIRRQKEQLAAEARLVQVIRRATQEHSPMRGIYLAVANDIDDALTAAVRHIEGGGE